MEKKRKETSAEGSEKREREQLGDVYMHTVVLTAGILAVLMACLKRAIMMLLLERWRAWVFLVLNLLLLAILFTSSFSSTSNDQTQECSSSNHNERVKNERKKKKRQWQCKKLSASGHEDDHERAAFIDEDMEAPTGSSREEDHMEDVRPWKEEDMEAEAPNKLSKEELNERAEAFIITFRQHLVLDAIKGSTGKHLFDRP
ncbi:hypothetical protein FNV43_RR14413 [Rhamnella rubrinervis]|uniref:Uncharacterized protein n=1 Tax=Rhamnella rubrinervis TaxID=2594499 RepID=A0A8K0H378_9ROSA|nr:hypothetical protein FNV43_RR14413 [Rhamnella rubrinervis]